MNLFYKVILIAVSILFCKNLNAQNDNLKQAVEDAMLRATRYMVEEVSTNGGYVWCYLPDLSRRWGEMEAYGTMIWMQHPGTISMGNTFLDAYKITGDEYYYEAAQKAASSVIWGQSKEGGWNYMIDFAGERSLKTWYNTIGKNGWRLEEFHYYYGNSTFDDDVTSDAARFLLRIYKEKLDPRYKPPLDKAIDFIVSSQYPLGGWPQRFPLRYDFSKGGLPDYSSYYTFNDDVIWENVHFLIQCYIFLGEKRFLDPIMRGMYFYLVSQDGFGGWAQQLDMSLRPVSARSYEPAAILPSTTFANAMLLLRFYGFTGDRRFIINVERAIKWLEESRLPEKETEGDKFTHPTFIEPETGKSVYVHRKGSNVFHGRYYVDYDPGEPLAHYSGRCYIDISRLKQEYEKINALPIDDVIRESPLFAAESSTESGLPSYLGELVKRKRKISADQGIVARIVGSLDRHGRWLVKHAMTSNPYCGEGQNTELTDRYASTMAGDETDTSPYRDTSDREYISTAEYIKNMDILIDFLKSNR